MATAQETGETQTQDNPGLKFCLWPKAFVHVAQTVVDRVFTEETLNQEYRSYVQSNDVQVTEIVKPTLRIAIDPRKLCWMLADASISAHGRKWNQYGEENFEKRVFGSMDVSITVDSSGPFYDPTYSANINAANLGFSVSSHGNGGNNINFKGNVFNGNVFNGNFFNGFNFNGNVFDGNFCDSFTDSINRSVPQENSRKRPSNNVFLNAGGIFTGNNYEPSTKRCRNETSITSSSTDGTSITCGGRNGISIISSGRGGTSITCGGKNGISVISNGRGGVSITSSGSQGTSVISNGTNKVTITNSGNGTDDDLGRTLCWALEKAVLERLNCHLPDYSFPLGSNCDWMFDFSTLSKPKFQNGYMESEHLAAICYKGDTVMLPTQAAPFPEPQNSRRMLTIFISNSIINTVGYCFHQHGILNYSLTEADLIPQATDDNSTPDTSDRARCLSDCFPEVFLKFPGAFVEVNMASSEAPTATFSGQSLKVVLSGSAIFRAHLADGSLVDFLTTEVSMVITVMLNLNMEKLMGTVTSILPRSITVVKSALGPVSRDVLKEAFDLIATQFLSRKMEEITQKGIPLPCPLLSGVEWFENVEVWVADDFLRIDADLKFHA